MLKDKFLRASTLLFIASMVANIFNYVFQLTMGRVLSTEDFGLMNSLFSLLLITSLPFMTIMTVLAKYVSAFMVEGVYDKIKGLLVRAYKNILSIGLLLLFVFVCLSFLIKSFLRMESVVPIVLLGVAVFTSLVLPINTAFLQGLQKFRPLSVVSGSLGPAKFVFCLAFVLLGLRVNGVFWGLILTNIAIFLISYAPLRSIIKSTSTSTVKIDDLFAYAVPVLLANLCFAILTQVDLILVRHYFPPTEVGVYASAAVLGRAIMYLPASLILALFPMVAEAHARNQKSYHLLTKALTYTIGLAGSGTLLYILFPSFIMGLLFGGKYVEAASLLGLYGFAMLPMGLLLIFINYNLACTNVKFIKYLVFVTCLQIFLIVFFHQTLTKILWIIFACGTASVMTILIGLILESHYLRSVMGFKAREKNC